jgi:hypothetical protein
MSARGGLRWAAPAALVCALIGVLLRSAGATALSTGAQP